MEKKEFFIERDGFKIHAKLDFPKQQNEKMPLVIVCHGLTGHMEETHIIGVAETITECGYISLRVEMYGHGQTDGQFCNHNVARWVIDLAYVIDYARSLDYVSDIYLSGHSQGGLASILVAGMKGDKLKGLIPLAPAINIVDLCKNGEFFGSKFDADHLPDRLQFWEDKYVTSDYIRIGRSLPVEDAIRAYYGPVLIIHATTDEAVPFSYSVDADKLYDNCKLVEIADDTHCYDKHLDQVKEALAKWLKEQSY